MDLILFAFLQFQYLRVDQSDKPHSQCYASMVKEINNNRRERTTVYESGKCGHSPNLTGTAWPSLYDKHHKQHTQHDFLGGSGVKRECAGTGVFLPRRYNHPPDPCKKSGNAIVSFSLSLLALLGVLI